MLTLEVLLHDVLYRFLHHPELADSTPENRAEACQRLMERDTADLVEAEADLAAWLDKSNADRQTEYDEYVCARERTQQAPAEKLREVDAVEVDIHLAAWPDQLMYLRAAVLAEVGIRRKRHGLREPRRRLAVNDYVTWCAEEEGRYRQLRLEAHTDLEDTRRGIEADCAFLAYVDEFLGRTQQETP